MLQRVQKFCILRMKYWGFGVRVGSGSVGGLTLACKVNEAAYLCIPFLPTPPW